MNYPKYDDASWHYEGTFPEDLPEECGATHIGMYMAWCIENNLLSEDQYLDNEEDIELVKEHQMTGARFLIINCDERLLEDDLNDIGNGFTRDYYQEGSDFSKHCDFLKDYSELFDQKAQSLGTEYETIYHIEDTVENYLLLKPILDKRFAEWKEYIAKKTTQ